MPLSALSDRGAVLEAIAEYDALGKEAFLSKYGYGASRSYLLEHNGRSYDSKAIAGVAVGKQFATEGPLRASDFSGGIQTVVRKLRQLGFTIAKSDEPGRNPDWSRDETILALDLYIRRRPQLPGEADPEVLALSKLLRDHAAATGVRGLSNFRNPDGVSMKVGNLSRLDPDYSGKGLPNGSAIEEKLWSEFMPDVARLYAAAASIRAQFSATVSTHEGLVAVTAGTPASSSVVDRAQRKADGAVSRGPAPSFGEVTHSREDGENSVYVMRLFGPIELLFPKRAMGDRAVIKVGRSNDVRRRAFELNCGFPPGLGLEWRPVQAQPLASAGAAHDVEQRLLGSLERRGQTIGGEFAIIPERDIHTLLADAIQPPFRS